MEDQPVTRLLRRMETGDRAAAEELYGLVYDELQRLARRLMASSGPQTLQPTAVIHEAWLKLAGGHGDPWTDRGHFLGVAARAMRSVLVDHARARKTAKRGGDARRVEVDEAMATLEESAGDLVALDAALEQLQTVDPELGRIVELKFFAGLSIAQTARAMDTSTATVERGWRTARTWLLDRLGGSASERGATDDA